MKLGTAQRALVEALRSGQYPKVMGELQTCDGYCAMGVACKVYEKMAGQELPRKAGNPYLLEGMLLTGSRRAVEYWFSFKDSRGGVLSQINDLRESVDDFHTPRHTHAQVADIIEQNPKHFFHESA